VRELGIGGRRARALGALLAVLVAYGALAVRLSELPSDGDVAFQALVVLPAFAAAIWLALSLSRSTTRTLLALAIATGVLAAACSLFGAGSAGNVAKLACYALVGFCFLTLFEELWWVALVALLVPWVDVWSVAAGPTEYVVEQRPGIFDHVAVALPSLGVGRRRGAPGAARRLPRVPRAERGPPLARRSSRTRPPYRVDVRSETDSTCGVCGNMSTGRQRTSS
jgi:hypothetical protein